MENVPERPKILTDTREKTSSKILNQIMKQDHSVTHSILGKIVAFAGRFFPNIWYKILSHKYYKKL